MFRNNITNTIKTKTKTRDMGIFFGHTVQPNRSLLTTKRELQSTLIYLSQVADGPPDVGELVLNPIQLLLKIQKSKRYLVKKHW